MFVVAVQLNSLGACGVAAKDPGKWTGDLLQRPQHFSFPKSQSSIKGQSETNV